MMRRRPLRVSGLFILAASGLCGQAIIAHLASADVTESSGVVASGSNSGIFWTHNDSGGSPALYAFDATGRSYGRWTVPGARNIDWEDIAIAPSAQPGLSDLYVGDIGDNGVKRPEIIVYRLPEPLVGSAAACADGCSTAPAAVIRLRYPDGPHNAETLLVHPVTRDLYVITKSSADEPETFVFVARKPEPGPKVATLTRVAILDLTDPLLRAFAGGLTGGAISPDGSGIALIDYLSIHQASVPVGDAFDSIWAAKFASRPIGIAAQFEGIGYRPDGKTLVLTSEGRPCPIVETDAAP